MIYLDTYKLRILLEYCQTKNKEILLKVDNLSRENKTIAREQYKAYLYTIKTLNHIISRNIKITKKNLYMLFKEQISELSHNKPLVKVFYEIMNYINDKF